jgi:hypothetical protein
MCLITTVVTGLAVKRRQAVIHLVAAALILSPVLRMEAMVGAVPSNSFINAGFVKCGRRRELTLTVANTLVCSVRRRGRCHGT